MTGYVTYMAAREHANDLLREAESVRRARQAGARRGRERSVPGMVPIARRAAVGT